MIEVFCDGGARGNPGPAAYGFVVKIAGQTVKSQGGYIGVATNNYAEYTAVIRALEWLSGHHQNQDLHFNLDSELAVRQLSGIYKIKNAHLRDLIFKIRSLETSFGQVSYRHIPRSQNKEADKLVNVALDKQARISKVKM